MAQPRLVTSSHAGALTPLIFAAQRRTFSVSPLRRSLATVSGRSPADHLSDQLAHANLLLNDLLDDDDRESEDFKSDLDEVQDAYQAVCHAYDGAIAAGSESEQVALRKNFDLAVVGLRDKLLALEKEAGR